MFSEIFVALFVTQVLGNNIEKYDGYKIFVISPETSKQRSILGILPAIQSLEILTDKQKKDVSVLVPPASLFTFATLLKVYDLKYQIKSINTTKVVKAGSTRRLGVSDDDLQEYISFQRYNRYPAIVAYLEKLAYLYPSQVLLIDLGKTSEDRKLLCLKISLNNNKRNKPAILVDAGIHAREWLAPSTALYLIKQLVENRENMHLLENVDWYIIPLFNPDGYEYSHTKDRFWRKNRSEGRQCKGADINRNFGFHWMESGASTNECSYQYGGSHAFSEPEAVNFKKFALQHAKTIKLYVTLHSYGSMLMYPWGFTKLYPKNHQQLQTVADQVSDAIRAVRGTNYTTGSSTNVLYPAAGGSDDWMKGVVGTPLAYTMELPEGGSHGFDAPESDILDVAEETFEGFKSFHNYVENKWEPKSKSKL